MADPQLAQRLSQDLPASGHCSGRTSAAPEVQANSTSTSDISKLNERICATRDPGLGLKGVNRYAARLGRPRWLTMTPLGRPVDPEV
jgi:hypothetical protein